MPKYLIYPSLAAAQSRSNVQAVALGCVPPTVYWWSQMVERQPTDPLAPRAALRIEADGPYGPVTTVNEVTAGLSEEEQAGLVDISYSDADWFNQD